MAGIKFHELIRHPSAKEEMPSQFEQDISEAYVCNRQITRPVTNFWIALKQVTIISMLTLLFAFILNKVLFVIGIYTHLPIETQKFQNENPNLFFFLFTVGLGFLVFIIFLRKILIGIVELYQHYASEDIRRRCLFKPTCSEHTILALKKYGVIIGLYKAYIRIFKKCRGNIYRIDYP